MKYWWLKKYKGLKIKLIPDLIRDVNLYFTLPKNYKDRYAVIKNSDISTLREEDLKILLVSILNHEKIKNNKVIYIIDELLKIPDNFMPETNYTLQEMLEEIRKLKTYNSEDKLSTNNVGACYNCLEVFYVDKIKYINKKRQCLCPYCRRANLYFDNDFAPMDRNFLRLARLFYENTSLGCKYSNIQKLLKKCVKLEKKIDFSNMNDYLFMELGKEKDFHLHSNHIQFVIPEVCYKKDITSKEEFILEEVLNEGFFIAEKNMISTVVIDLDIFSKNTSNSFNLSCLLTVLENLGRNLSLKKVILLGKDNRQYNTFSKMMMELLKK